MSSPYRQSTYSYQPQANSNTRVSYMRDSGRVQASPTRFSAARRNPNYVATIATTTTHYSMSEFFNRYDRNRDGFLDFEELRHFYRDNGVPLGDEEIRVQLRCIKPRNNDRINFEEFQRIVKFK